MQQQYMERLQKMKIQGTIRSLIVLFVLILLFSSNYLISYMIIDSFLDESLSAVSGVHTITNRAECLRN